MNIGQIYIIPANTRFWSIALQESVMVDRDLFVKLTNTCYNSDLIFGALQHKIFNLDISFLMKKDMSSYIDRHNGEIEINKNKLIEI